MKLPVILCFLFLFSADALSQQELYPSRYFKIVYTTDHQQIDSLIKEINHHGDDSLKVRWLTTVALLYHSGKNDSTLIFAERAYQLALKLDDAKGISISLAMLGDYYGTHGKNNLDKSLLYYQKRAEVAEKNVFAKDMQQAYSCILNVYFYTGDFPSAMRLSTKALTQAEENNDTEKIAYYNNLLGFIHLHQGNTEASRNFYQQYFEKALIIQDSTMMAEAMIGFAEVDLLEKNPEKAIPLLFQVREYYQSKVKNIGINFLKAEKIPYTAFTLAKAYRDQEKYDLALQECLNGFQYSQQFPFNLYDLANYYIITGGVYEDLGQMKKAIETLHLGLKLSINIKHAENIRDAYESLARIYERKKMFDSAYYYQKQFSTMKDSITNVRTRREIEQINAEYSVAKKDHEIQQQEQLHKSEITKRNILTASVVAFFLLFISMGVLLYNRYRLKQRSEFQVELNRKQNELFNAVTSIQDRERKRIAQDIHDQVGSVLSAAKLQFSGLEELKGQLTDDQKKKYSSAMVLMDQAAEELRNISHNLMPATLSRLGLVAALHGLFDKISEYSGLKIIFSSHGFEKRLDEPIEINIYPMVLELINNVVKHASASEATVQLIRYPEYINITVEDNGKGFNEMNISNGNGIGMRNLKSRIDYLRGNLNIDSAEGKGTTIMIDIPIII